MARLGRAQPFKPLILRVRGTMSFSSIFTETITNTATFSGAKAASFTETITNLDTLLRSAVRTFTETITNTATLTTVSTYLRTFTESITNTDTFARVWTAVRTFTEMLTNTATVAFKLNGSDVIWYHIAKSADATYSKILRASTSWTHINRN